VVVAGGALVSSWVRAGNGQVALCVAAERMTVAAALLRQHAHLRLVFTGAEGMLNSSGDPEAVQAQRRPRSQSAARRRRSASFAG
jgi:hypothetical protein